MLNFSKSAKLTELVEAISNLPVAHAFEQTAKELALQMLAKVEQTGAHVSIRVNLVAALSAQQVEIQVSGRRI